MYKSVTLRKPLTLGYRGKFFHEQVLEYHMESEYWLNLWNKPRKPK